MAIEHVTGAQLATVLGVARSTITNLAADGVVVRVGRGEFDLAASVQSYLKHRLEQAKAVGDDTTVRDLTAERARLARLKADQVEREARTAAGELIPASDVQRTWIAIVTAVRTRLLLIPTKVAARLTGKAPAEVQSLLRAEINAALAELSTQRIA